jgi:hypothetical protein
MRVVYIQPRPKAAWKIRDCIPTFQKKYKVKFGKRQILKMLRLTDVIDEYNNVLKPYQDLKLFQHQEIDIETDDYKLVNSYRTLYLTKRGIVFVGRHLQSHPNISLTAAMCEYLERFKLIGVPKQ